MSGYYEAPTDFSPLVAQNSSSNKNIAIVGTLNVDINASYMVDSVVAGAFKTVQIITGYELFWRKKLSGQTGFY